MNKKLIALIPTLVICFSCNKDSREKLYDKTFYTSYDYIVNEENEATWLKDNFQNIKLYDSSDPDAEKENSARCEYYAGNAKIESLSAKDITTYDQLIEKMKELNIKVRSENAFANVTMSVENVKNGVVACHYTNYLKPTDVMTGEFSLSNITGATPGFTLIGNGTLKKGEKTYSSNMEFAIVDWKDNKIACTHLRHTVGPESLMDNEFNYIFPMKDGSSDHVITCYINLLPETE